MARVGGTSPSPRLPRRRRGRRCCCHCPSIWAPTTLPWLLPPMLSSPCAVLPSDEPSSTPSRTGSTMASWWHRRHHGAVGITISLAGGLRSDACHGRLSSPGPGCIGYAIGVGDGIVATAVWVAQVAPAGVAGDGLAGGGASSGVSARGRSPPLGECRSRRAAPPSSSSSPSSSPRAATSSSSAAR